MAITISLPAKRYEDFDDCLTAAAEDVQEERGLEGWDLNPRWANEERDAILLDIPEWAADGEEAASA